MIFRFGETVRRPAPESWCATHLFGTPILGHPLVVEHHYEAGGAVPEPAGEEAMTVPLIHFSDRSDLERRPPSWL